MLSEGESVTDRFDCNTVVPVPVASGYSSRTLTHSAAHVLVNSNNYASSPQLEAISPKTDRAPVLEARDSGIQITTFTDSHLRLEKEEVLQNRNPFNRMPKSSCFTQPWNCRFSTKIYFLENTQ